MMDVRLLVRGVVVAAKAGRSLTAQDVLGMMAAAGMVGDDGRPTPELEAYVSAGVWHSGVVRFYLAERDYGFVVPDDGSEDVFVHRRSVPALPVDLLVKGARVRYTSEPSKRGLRATALELA